MALLEDIHAAATAAPSREMGAEYSAIRVASEPERAWHQDREYVPDLLHPGDIEIYGQMLADAQVWGLMSGLLAPIHGYQWSIDPAGANEEDAAAQAKALGLPLFGVERDARAQMEGFTFNETLETILLALPYRYFYLSLGLDDAEGGRGKYTLKRLGRRPPWTIAYDGIYVDGQGDLLGIKQNIGWVDPVTREIDPLLDADGLAAFVWGRAHGGYLGRSILRPLYGNWYLKRGVGGRGGLVAIDMVNHELNGAGTVVATAAQGASELDKASLIAAGNSMRAQPHRAVVVPFGSNVARLGVQGATPDTIASIRYHDEQMSKAFGQMVIDLAQTSNGSRALGDTFADLLGSAQEQIARWVQATFTSQVIRKVTTLNYGDGTPCPILRFDRVEDPELSIADLATLVEKGVVTPDPVLEEAVREKYKLPKPAKAPVAVTAPPFTVTAAGVPAPLAERGLRRQLTDLEIRAGADFNEIDDAWRKALGGLLDKVRDGQAKQIEALADQVAEAADDPVALANLTGVSYGADAIADALVKMAAEGSRQVVQEAKHQDVAIDGADPDLYEPPLRSRAQAAAQTLGNGLAQAASKKAQQLVGLKPAEVKTKTVEHLQSLSDAYLVDTLGGELTGAQNLGRRTAMDDFPEGTTFVASELLDGNTCGPCADVDGREYDTLEEAQNDYPGSGGYVGCDGGPRCRGTFLAVAPDETPASVGLGERS